MKRPEHSAFGPVIAMRSVPDYHENKHPGSHDVTTLPSPPIMCPQPFVIRLTPRGRSAIASLLLVGQGAMTVLEPCLIYPDTGQSRRDRRENNVPVFAYFSLGKASEEVILNFCYRDAIELHCHGGDAVVRAIEAALVERGAVSRTWQDWHSESQGADDFSHCEPLDRIQREAMQLLPFAETELTAKLLLAQYYGALSRRIQQVLDLLDSTENNATTNKAVQKAMSILDSLLASYESGWHLTAPFRVGLIGPVNVGKSSLMNALVGFNRSIISPVAGTTRDTVSAKTVIAGWPVMLIDTAGIRETSNPIEQEGIARMQAVVADSDLLLFITDACETQPRHSSQVVDISTITPIIHVVNKIDLVEQHVTSFFPEFPDSVPVSALTGTGLDRLNEVILDNLHKSSYLDNDSANLSKTALVFTERQYFHLSSARQLLNRGEIVSAISLLCVSVNGDLSSILS